MAVAMATVVRVCHLSRLFYSGKSYVHNYVQTARRCAQNTPKIAYQYQRKSLIPDEAERGCKVYESAALPLGYLGFVALTPSDLFELPRRTGSYFVTSARSY